MGPRTFASLFVGCLLLGCSGQNKDQPASEQAGSLLVQVAGQADPADGLPKPMSAEQAAAYADVVDRFGAGLILEPGSLDHVIGFSFATYSVKRADLAVLKNFPDLQELRFSGDNRIPGSPGITDAHLEHLEGLTNLRSLSLNSTKVTGGGLAHLLPLTKLKFLSLWNSRNVQDPGLLYIARFKQLEGLELTYVTNITDAGLAHLKALQSLEYLNLYGTGVTDAGVVHLKAMKSLKSLNIRGTNVTEAGQQELLKALPNLKFSYDP
jgi:hypothetical protein